MRALVVLLALTACGGASVDVGDQPSASECTGGALRVRGAGIEIVRASYRAASPPERLLAHSVTPAAWVSVESDWTEFHLYEPADIVEVVTTDYATGERLCPLWSEALP